MVSKFKQYKEFLIYFGISSIGLYLFYLSLNKNFKITKETLWELWGAVDSSFAVAVGILAIFVYKEMARAQDIIELKFQIGNKEPIETGLSLLRKNFTRSEIMGILGMIQKEQEKKYRLEFFQDKKVLKKIQDIQTGKERVFIIKMSQKEAKQFNI